MLWGKTKEKKNKGFTLIELIIVVAVLAILVGILAPQYTKYVEKSRKAADVSNVNELVNAFKVFVIEGGNLNSTEYTFKIDTTPNNGGTSGGTNLKGCYEGNSAKNETALRSGLDSTCPGWEDIYTKSKKWGDNGKTSDITVIIKVTSDGGVSVSYKPDKFAAYMGSGE